MRLWKIAILYLVLTPCIIGCSTPKFGLNQKTKNKLSQIRGQIEVKFVSDKVWHYRIVNGEMLLESKKNWVAGSLDKRPFIYLPKEAPRGFPEIQGFEYHGPYSLSPDKTLMVLSISSPTQGRSLPEDFVIVQAEKKEVLFQGRNRERYKIEDIAWSPDSSMFVVLEESSRRSLSVSGILHILIGHPSKVSTFYLSIYDRKATLVVRTKVVSGLTDGSGQVLWKAKESFGKENE